MTQNNAKIRINELINTINYHNKIYFAGKPEISDYEFDQLLEELKALEEKYPQFLRQDSPTQKVGESTTKNFKSVEHLHPMLSLANSYSKEELLKFIERIEKLLPNEKIEYFCELKFDGSAISIIYEDNKILRAITRGDGTKGDDITENIKTIKNIPHTIEYKFKKAIEVRGEVFMPKKVFEEINKDRLKANEKLFANPRNAAAGTLKLLDSTLVADRKLDFYAFSLIVDDGSIKTQEEGIKQLEKLKINVSQTYRKCANIDEIFQYINQWENKKNDLEVDIDGIVIKVNDLNQQIRLGTTAKSPRWAIAYKYKPENVSTILESIDFQVGRIGTITPVANLRPIHISGTIVKRASLHNSNEIQRLDVRIGDTVFVEKGGEIIPKITGIDLTKRKKEFKPIKFVEYCPDCNSKLVSFEGEANIYCMNSKNCSTQIKGNIEHFASRNAMNIDELGPQTINQLYQKSLIKNIADLYELKFEDILKLEGFKTKSAENLLKGIAASIKMPFKKVLFGLGIRHIGVSIAEKLVQKFKNIENLQRATFYQLIETDDIGEQIAKSIITYFEDQYNRLIIERLKKFGLKFEISEKENIIEINTLKEKIFVVSGSFDNFSREGIKEYIKKHGGNVVGTISKKTQFLVAGEKPGPQKIEKAEKLGIEVINENKLMKLAKGGS